MASESVRVPIDRIGPGMVLWMHRDDLETLQQHQLLYEVEGYEGAWASVEILPPMNEDGPEVAD